MANRLAVVIPAYRPSAGLIDVVRQLSARAPAAIVVVDDGSGPDYQDTFAAVAALPHVQLLRHALNLGKGAALKTAFNHVLCTIPDAIGVVTADADGQYHPDDIAKVADRLAEQPEALVLGARSKVGNPAARGLMQALLGQKLADTQTGLHGIPMSLLPRLLRLESTRYEFALEMLQAAKQIGIPIVEQTIRTIYEPIGVVGVRRKWMHPFALALGAVFLGLAALTVYGFRTADLFGQDIWDPQGLRRFTKYAEYYAVFAVILTIVARRYFALAIAALVLALTIVSVGPSAPAAVVLFLLSANALGSMALRKAEAVEDQVCATLLGVGFYTFLMTFVCRIPVNYPAVWAVVLAAPVALDWSGVRRRAVGWLELLRTRTSPAFALLAFALIAHWVVALKPESSADGLAMHLSIPANIAMEHRFTIEPSQFVWAVMPMAADFAYSIVYLIGGEYASRLLVFALLLAVCTLLYGALRRWTSPWAAHLLTAVFAASPIVQLVTGSLLVENFVAAMVLGALTAVWRFGETGDRRNFFAAMVLGGTAVSAKMGALAFVALALPFVFVEASRRWKTMGPRPAAACALGVVLLLACAAPPYAIAYVKTGNPVFPALTTKFPSPLMPFEVRDARFRKPLSGRTLYDLTFYSDQYYEGQRGSVGFQWVALAPLGLLGLAAARRREALSAAVVATGASLIVLATEPNARYLYAAMPLALIPAGATLGWLAQRGRAVYAAVLLYTTACAGMNLWFLPSSSYYHKDFALRQPFSRAERGRYISEAISIRKVIEHFNQEHARSPVLFTHEGSNAGTNGIVYENHWHQPTTYLKIQEATDLPSMLALMQGWNIRHFISHKPMPDSIADPPLLAEFLAKCTLPEFEVGDYYLARIEPGCRAKEIAEPAIVVRPGYYGDDDPAIVYHGDWKQDPPGDGPDLRTRTRAETPGAQASFAFDGKRLYYVFTRGPHHGIASVTIDGEAREPIDMYHPSTDWQHKVGYCCFAPGRHVIVVRSTDAKNPASTGYTVDIDSFSVVQ